MVMTGNELRRRSVVRICDGKNLGCVTDIRFDSCTGKLCGLCIQPDEGGLFSFGCADMFFLAWENIRCIGDDVILADVKPEDCVCRKKKGRDPYRT